MSCQVPCFCGGKFRPPSREEVAVEERGKDQDARKAERREARGFLLLLLLVVVRDLVRVREARGGGRRKALLNVAERERERQHRRRKGREREREEESDCLLRVADDGGLGMVVRSMWGSVVLE